MKNPLFSRLLEDFIEYLRQAITAHKIAVFKFEFSAYILVPSTGVCNNNSWSIYSIYRVGQFKTIGLSRRYVHSNLTAKHESRPESNPTVRLLFHVKNKLEITSHIIYQPKGFSDL